METDLNIVFNDQNEPPDTIPNDEVEDEDEAMFYPIVDINEFADAHENTTKDENYEQHNINNDNTWIGNCTGQLDDSEDDVPISRLNGIGPRNSDDDSDVPLKSLRKLAKADEEYVVSEEYVSSESEALAMKYKKRRRKKINRRAPRKTYVSTRTLKSYVCGLCGLDLKHSRKLKQHIRSKHGKTYSCRYCSLKFKDKSLYKDHKNTHTGKTPYLCETCPLSPTAWFSTRSQLSRHNQYEHGVPNTHVKKKRRYRCNFCDKDLSTPGTLAEHVRLHTGEKPVQCEICQKGFTRDRDLKQHMNLHAESWKCRICERCFVTPFKLKEHYRLHTGEKPYQCTKCDRKFSRAADFRYHVGTHMGIKPYACDLCDLRFTTSSSVTRHKANMHSSTPRDYACTICSRAFFTEARLNSHMRNHEIVKNITCEHCPLRFASYPELRRHMRRRHVGHYPCSVCDFICLTPQQLEFHMGKHDLVGKPYPCNVCGFGYKTPQSLVRHLAKVHKFTHVPKIQPQHLCALCGQVFDLKDKLNKHLKEEHVVIVMGELEVIDCNESDQRNINKSNNTVPPVKTEPTNEEAANDERVNDVDVVDEGSDDGEDTDERTHYGEAFTRTQNANSELYQEFQYKSVKVEPTDLSKKILNAVA